MFSRVRRAVARVFRLRERAVGGSGSGSGSGNSIQGSSTRGSSARGSSGSRGTASGASSGASRTGSDSAASKHSPTVKNLNARIIRAAETEYVNSFDTEEKCRETSKAFFDLLCPNARGLASDNSPFYRALLKAFDTSYLSEIKFNEDLFTAVGKCIQDLSTEKERQFKFRSPVVCTGNLIVLALKERLVIGDTEYAAGLVREATLPMDRRSILSRDARLDHAAVMLRRAANIRRDEDWEVWVALAVVDLKIQGTGVRDLGTNNNGNVDPTLLHPLVARKHGALAQVVMYTAAHALRGTAALGLKFPEFPERIPFAVVSCKGESKARKDESNWVHGNLVVPEVCGFPYAFNVDAYGNLVEQGNHSSLASYLHVMGHGLKLASAWLKEASEARQPPRKTPAPHRMSGRSLHFGTDKPLTRDGTNEAQLVLVATPVSKYGVSGLRVSQGELFKATVNLQKLRSSVSGPDEVFWCHDTYADKETSVLIKVSSRSCFNLLVPPESAYLYGSEDDVWKLRRGVRDVLSKSLYGFYLTASKHGLVQLLPDLQKKKYGTLRPEDWLFAGTWGALWDAFAGFVTGTLLPLAKHRIVHADLRAGCDVTSNVLYNPGAGSMRMIDLDSLCVLKSLSGMTSILDKRNIDPKHLPPNMRKTALGFVLGQVMCVAEAWHGGGGRDGGIREAEVNANSIITEAAKSNAAVKGAAAGVDEALIATVLAQYRAKFREKFGKRKRPSSSPSAS